VSRPIPVEWFRFGVKTIYRGNQKVIITGKTFLFPDGYGFSHIILLRVEIAVGA
jgi:hypothetical protein